MSERPPTFKVGDRVEWHSAGGTSHGKVKRKLTAPIEIKGFHVAATEDDPRYLIVSDTSGDEAAHKAEALRKL